MPTVTIAQRPRGLTLLLGWRRLRFTICFALAVGLFMGLHWKSSLASILVRTVAVGLVGMLVFGLFEQWPRRLPRWVARWVLQVVGVAFVIPWTTLVIYLLSTEAGAPAFWLVRDRMEGFAALTGMSLLLAPWVALGALVRQKDAIARHQALAFDLQRSELERQALDARLNLLQAQVAPHFLFNTLANVQALVDTGSPQAAAVLRSLIAYLRAAVPRLHASATRLGQELELARAYLELMHMRIPDRLQFSIHADPDTLQLRCPPMTLLTLVENAVRHGIDPSEEGGRIDIRIERRGERCLVQVSDTGMGLQVAAGGGLGTGLVSLRERLDLSFRGDAHFSLGAQQPQGAVATIDFPAEVALS